MRFLHFVLDWSISFLWPHRDPDHNKALIEEFHSLTAYP